jgi:hypothetical protein
MAAIRSAIALAPFRLALDRAGRGRSVTPKARLRLQPFTDDASALLTSLLTIRT